ncbi:DUF2971 domain-containing protein [Vibrio anguillarum]|uniref:DUF2971 domain-containing protein n=1 Tax=Vibrio anguillarum TaxID=55601 RepID=UPI001F2A1542|nr:DUF2971 domain-containing protein [Vibrio anguillarum]
MLLYKYRSIDDLWNSLDIIFNQRVWCSKWEDLNDPLEGRYHSDFGSSFDEKINASRDQWRICALSSSIDNFLLWSHYAAGHKGIAIEIDIPKETPDLSKVIYSPFSPIFTDISESMKDQKNLFEIKTEEWSYEEEYRLLCKSRFYKLPNPIKRIYLGHNIQPDKAMIIRKILPSDIEIIQMKLDAYQGKVVTKNLTRR